MRKLIKEFGGLIVEAIAAIISIFLDHTEQLSEWLGSLYPILHPALFLAIGLLMGLSLSSLKRRREYDSMLSLLPAQLCAVELAREAGGEVVAPYGSELERTFQSLQRLGLADTPDGAPRGSYWYIAPEVARAARGDRGFKALLEEAEAAALGWFDSDGSFHRAGEDGP